MTLLVLAAALIWISILLLPWQPWRMREVLEAAGGEGNADLSSITVLIPARNEAEGIVRTLTSIAAQGCHHQILLVDDQSTDDTAALAASLGLQNFTIIQGKPLPGGWSGKLWALEQGQARVKTALLLLLDADIELQPGSLVAIRDKLIHERLDFLSLMACLRMESFWEKLLIPAFVYFFKLLYPFRLSNSPKYPFIAAAAGGCILLRTEVLQAIGGFAAIKDALIDDCSLAKAVKVKGYRTWIGVSQGVVSHRCYSELRDIWNMVARTAYTQLHYSVWLLLLCTLMLVVMFLLPVYGILAGGALLWGAWTALLAMLVSYIPTLRYYRRSLPWVFSLPVIGLLYLAMTWTSAIRYWRGERAHWKGRVYQQEFERP